MSISIASFWVLRPEEHPKAADYPAMLRILQASCDRLDLRHVVLTDERTAASPQWPEGIEPWVADDVPQPLMKACTEVQAQYLDSERDADVLFVGADAILLADPREHCPPDADLCVTARRPSDRLDAINNGFMLVRNWANEKAACLYRRVANRCGAEWRDDQKALVAELAPVPLTPGTHERAGMNVAFLPMRRFNHAPLWSGDPCKDVVLLHFRGQERKKQLFAWAKKRRLT